jgi:hypothetical protein
MPMLEAFSTPHNRTLTSVFLAGGCSFAMAAIVVGVDDNPPGILLAFLAATASVLAFVHPWRTARQFRLLLFASLLGFVLFAILHNVFDAAASLSATVRGLRGLLQALSVAAFFLAILVCPSAFFVGAVGAPVMFIRSRRRPT